MRPLAALTAGTIFLQLILGAAFRHKGTGIAPHLVGAGVVTLLVVWTSRTVVRRYSEAPALRRAAWLLALLLGLQLLLGAAAYWAVLLAREYPQPVLLTVWPTVAHVAVGALTLAASVLLVLCCFRVLKPARAARLVSESEQAAFAGHGSLRGSAR